MREYGTQPRHGPRDHSMSKDKRKLQKQAVDKKYTLTRLWGYLGHYRLLLLLAAVLTIVSNLLSLYGPKLSGQAIDAIGIGPGQADFPVIRRCILLMLVCYLGSALLSYLLQFIIIRLTRNVVYRMRKDVFEKLSALPVSYFDKRQTGDIISVISYDIDTVSASLSSDFLQVCQSVVMILGSFWMMLQIAPPLVLIFAFTVPLSIFVTRYITKKTRPLFSRRSAALGSMNGYAEEMIGGLKTTRLMGAEDTVIRRFDEENRQAVKSQVDAEYYAVLSGPSVNLINNLSMALISVFGSILYLAGGIGLGDISSFVLYSRKFSGPINETANIIGELQSALAAAERVFRLIDEAPEPPDADGARDLEHVKGAVELEHITFGYETGKPILKDFSLRAEPGEMVAIVGPTGAGKTTIISLLMRFYDPDTGRITIDGQDIGTLTRDSLRRAYTMVLQDTWLFHGTIFENIAYGKEGATMEEVVAAAKAAHIHSYISRLPKGYDTVLSDGGMNISKGQKQLLTIARAILLDAKMLILDEATSNVDTRTEEQIQQAMRQLMQGRTCFVIAHRLSTIRAADKIVVLQNGGAAECGTHEELMARGGVYASLYAAQFEAS